MNLYSFNDIFTSTTYDMRQILMHNEPLKRFVIVQNFNARTAIYIFSIFPLQNPSKNQNVDIAGVNFHYKTLCKRLCVYNHSIEDVLNADMTSVSM